MSIPDKCLECEHTIIQLENVHYGRGRFRLEPVVRCDCFPTHYKVGCVCANQYCEKPQAEKEVSE